ncbi:MAG TPA: type II toxin-antitoxin system HicA family toxin [Candidatus Deferrimicrobium sp.]|nr:type II toxin-antitoxin system HicA family toxin [Candidatus Kapabacteria bacterium]HLP57267.1 type II toxin-antitoxin system HicA family toxin [Candidatus Deferrimicrobium sp.]
MSKKEKLIKKFTTVPVKSDLTYTDLKTLLESLGYKEIEGSGSRVKFFNEEIRDLILLHKPHPGNILNKATIKDIQKKLKNIME